MRDSFCSNSFYGLKKVTELNAQGVMAYRIEAYRAVESSNKTQVMRHQVLQVD